MAERTISFWTGRICTARGDRYSVTNEWEANLLAERVTACHAGHEAILSEIGKLDPCHISRVNCTHLPVHPDMVVGQGSDQNGP